MESTTITCLQRLQRLPALAISCCVLVGHNSCSLFSNFHYLQNPWGDIYEHTPFGTHQPSPNPTDYCSFCPNTYRSLTRKNIIREECWHCSPKQKNSLQSTLSSMGFEGWNSALLVSHAFLLLALIPRIDQSDFIAEPGWKVGSKALSLVHLTTGLSLSYLLSSPLLLQFTLHA